MNRSQKTGTPPFEPDATASRSSSPSAFSLPSRRILAGNLLLFKELEELLGRFDRPVMLLKGAGLLASGRRRAEEREMGDIDLLVRSSDREALIAAIESMGFAKYPDDPNQFRKGTLSFDVHDEIWYLNAEEFEAMWSAAKEFPVGSRSAWVQSTGDFLMHVLAHACIHHADSDPKWIEDARSLLADADLSAVQREAKRLGLYPPIARFLSGHGLAPWPAPASPPLLPMNGHLQRLWYLRGWRFRGQLVWKTLFPDAQFIKRRYDLRTDGAVWLWRLRRPFGLMARALRAWTRGPSRK